MADDVLNPPQLATPLTNPQRATLLDVIRIAHDGFKFIGEALASAQAVADRGLIDPAAFKVETLRTLIPDAELGDLEAYVGFWLAMNESLEANNGALRKAFRRLEGEYAAVFNR